VKTEHLRNEDHEKRKQFFGLLYNNEVFVYMLKKTALCKSKQKLL